MFPLILRICEWCHLYCAFIHMSKVVFFLPVTSNNLTNWYNENQELLDQLDTWPAAPFRADSFASGSWLVFKTRQFAEQKELENRNTFDKLSILSFQQMTVLEPTFLERFGDRFFLVPLASTFSSTPRPERVREVT